MLLLKVPETIRRLASCADGNEASVEKGQLLLVASTGYLRLPLKKLPVPAFANKEILVTWRDTQGAKRRVLSTNALGRACSCEQCESGKRGRERAAGGEENRAEGSGIAPERAESPIREAGRSNGQGDSREEEECSRVRRLQESTGPQIRDKAGLVPRICNLATVSHPCPGGEPEGVRRSISRIRHRLNYRTAIDL
ncbi:hypothetical protein HN011_003899 [Eciton burchellii]|nr:hypothetical protein HN011_003899 [Eciton burchellii]